MPLRVPVLATIIALRSAADPPRPGALGAAPSGELADASGTVEDPPTAMPSVRIEVRSELAPQDASFLRGALVLRVLDRGYCVTTGAADLVVTLVQGPDQTVVAVTDDTTRHEHVVVGAGALAALETIHRADAGLLRGRSTAMDGGTCRDDAIAVRTNADEDGELVRDFVAGLSVAGHSLVRGDTKTAGQVCVRREAQDVVVGRGPGCEAVVRIPAVDPGDGATTQLDRAVGAALAVGREQRPRSVPAEAEAEAEARAEPEPEPEPTSIATVPPAVARAEAPLPEPSPRASLHALVVGGAVARKGGFDGAGIVAVGASVGPGIIVAGEVTMIPAKLEADVFAVDTDVMAELGRRLELSPRSGLRFTAAGGARIHWYRIDDGPVTTGRTTYVVGAGLAGYWRVGRDLTVELGMSQRFAGQGWIHEVGLDVAGERGRSTTMFVLGLAWLGRRR